MRESEDKAIRVFGERLDSSTFTWQRYCGTVGVSIIRIFDSETQIFNRRFTCLGWCHADELLGGFSKSQGIAIMLWIVDEQQKVWCHVSHDLFETLNCRYELICNK